MEQTRTTFIPAPGRHRQAGLCEFEVGLVYTVRPCLERCALLYTRPNLFSDPPPTVFSGHPVNIISNG